MNKVGYVKDKYYKKTNDAYMYVNTALAQSYLSSSTVDIQNRFSKNIYIYD